MRWVRLAHGGGLEALVADGVFAGAFAGALSGAPSTIHALLTGGSLLATTRAAGALLGRPTVVRGALAHAGVSFGWGVVIAGAVRRADATDPWRAAVVGASAGVAIAALDLGVVARRLFPGIRALPSGPQVADHLAFGAIAGIVVAQRHRAAGTGTELC